MTVGELIDILSDFDPSQEVRIMSRPSWPFEYKIRGMVCRKEFDCVREDNDDSAYEGGDDDDVFIVEGEQLKYGTKKAWDLT